MLIRPVISAQTPHNEHIIAIPRIGLAIKVEQANPEAITPQIKRNSITIKR